MNSKYCVKRRHYAISFQSISIYRTNRSSTRNSRIIYKIILSDYIISIQILIIYNFSFKIFFLTNYPQLCRICKRFSKFIIFILFCYSNCYLRQLTLFPIVLVPFESNFRFCHIHYPSIFPISSFNDCMISASDDVNSLRSATNSFCACSNSLSVLVILVRISFK